MWEVCLVLVKIGISTGTWRLDIKVTFEQSYCSDILRVERKWTYVSGKLAGPRTAGWAVVLDSNHQASYSR